MTAVKFTSVLVKTVWIGMRLVDPFQYGAPITRKTIPQRRSSLDPVASWIVPTSSISTLTSTAAPQDRTPADVLTASVRSKFSEKSLITEFQAIPPNHAPLPTRTPPAKFREAVTAEKEKNIVRCETARATQRKTKRESIFWSHAFLQETPKHFLNSLWQCDDEFDESEEESDQDFDDAKW